MRKRKLTVAGFEQASDPFDEQKRNLQLRYGHFERSLEIDQNNLDAALLTQPQLISQVSDVYAEIISLRDGLEDRVKQAEARAYVKQREQFTGKEKPTEAAMKHLITLDKHRIRTVDQHIWAEGEAKRWEGMQSAFRDRGFVLRQLAEMWAFGYFTNSSAKMSGNADFQDAAIKRRREAIAEKRGQLKARRERNK